MMAAYFPSLAILLGASLLMTTAGAQTPAIESKVATAAEDAAVAEAALRPLLVALAQGKPDYAKLSGWAVQDVMTDLSQMRETLQRLGPLRAMNYTGHGDFGEDAFVFNVQFAKGEERWIAVMGLDNTIRSLGWLIITIPPLPKEPLPALIANLGRALSAASTAGEFSGAVLVARDGNIVFEKAYGLADRERRRPNGLETRFRIASMSKMFTAVAILQLAQEGKLSLDAPIAIYLPEYPNKHFADITTIHQLLTHTSGAGDIFGPIFDQYRKTLRDPADYIRIFGPRPTESKPGGFHYSNYGFIVLGRIVEIVSGKRYDDYVSDHIFKPTGMSRSGNLPEAEHVADRSVPYTWGGAGLKSSIEALPLKGSPAEGAYSTVGDLFRFSKALMDDTLLDREHEALLTKMKIEVRKGVGYAYGFEDRNDSGFEVIGHAGDNPGVNADLRIIPSGHYVVVSLANIDAPAAKRFSSFVIDRLQVGKPGLRATVSH